MPITDNDPCPCGRDSTYSACCGLIHRAGKAGVGTTAEQLMRARYSAYVLHDGEFLLASWHGDTRPESVGFTDQQQWQGLTVVSTEGGGGLETDGTVEFRARFQRGSDHFELHELSSFVRDGGTWYYLDGLNPDG